MKIKEFEAKAYLFLKGELDPDEKKTFEEALKRNPQYARLLDTYSNILDIHGKELNRESSGLHLSLPGKEEAVGIAERKFRRGSFRFAMFALVIVLLITTGFFLISLKHDQPDRNISAGIVKSIDVPGHSTGDGEIKRDTKKTLESSFRKEDSLVSVAPQARRRIEPLPPLSQVIVLSDEKQGNVIFVE